MILIDTNVVVAAVYDLHIHHDEALPLFETSTPLPIMLAAHSLAEAYVTLTRQGTAKPVGWSGPDTRSTLAIFREAVKLVAMTPQQTIEAIERFADIGIGARLYDYLIGRTGVLYGATAIVTFNTRHMRALFPQVAVHTPGEWTALNPAPPPPP